MNVADFSEWNIAKKSVNAKSTEVVQITIVKLLLN
jgi:hypothetical protein